MRSTVLATAAGSLLLAACGDFTSSGEIERGGRASGSASGFSSVFVNGQRFDTGDAVITVDGQTVSESALSVGMQIDVLGEVTDGVASRVEFDRTLRGPIDAIDRPDARPVATLTVLGQTVSVNELTVFDASSLDALTTNMVIDVSALRGTDGALQATWLRPATDNIEPTSTDLDVEGPISSLSANGFAINGLTIDAAATGTAGLADGQLVEVRGRQPVRGGVLAASDVSPVDVALIDGEPVTLEGVISEPLSTGDFQIGPYTVTLAGVTRLDATGLLPASGQRVQLFGTARGGNQVAATQLRVIPPPQLGLVAPFEGRNADGSLQLLGTAVELSDSAYYLDLGAQRDRTFRADDIELGDVLHVLGHSDVTGRFVATRIERLDPGTATSVRGAVRAVNSQTGQFQLAGLTISTSQSTVFRNADNQPVTAQQFFGNLTDRSFALARGGIDGAGVFAATDVRQQDRGR